MVSDLRIGWLAMVVLASPALLPRATSSPSWQIYAFRDGAVVTLSNVHKTAVSSTFASKRPPPATPADWRVTAMERFQQSQ